MKKILLVLLVVAVAGCKKESDVNSMIVKDAPARAGVEKKLYVFAKNGINLREKADRNSAVMKLLPYGSELDLIDGGGNFEQIDGITANWVQASDGTSKGWLFSGYVTDSAAVSGITPSADAPGNTIAGKYICNANPEYTRITLKENHECAVMYNTGEETYDVGGIWIQSGNVLVLKTATTGRYTFDSGFSNIVLEIVNNGELKIISDVIRYDGAKKYGFCSPAKGEVYAK